MLHSTSNGLLAKLFTGFDTPRRAIRTERVIESLCEQYAGDISVHDQQPLWQIAGRTSLAVL